MTHLEVLAVIVGLVVLLRGFGWLIGRLLDRPVKRQPARVVPTDDGLPLTHGMDLFQPRCEKSTALAATRIRPASRDRGAA